MLQIWTEICTFQPKVFYIVKCLKNFFFLSVSIFIAFFLSLFSFEKLFCTTFSTFRKKSWDFFQTDWVGEGGGEDLPKYFESFLYFLLSCLSLFFSKLFSFLCRCIWGTLEKQTQALNWLQTFSLFRVQLRTSIFTNLLIYISYLTVKHIFMWHIYQVRGRTFP